MDDSTKTPAPSSHQNVERRPIHSRAFSQPANVWRSQPASPVVHNERSPLSRSYSTADILSAEEDLAYTGGGQVAGGTIMGIHNLAIVFPQFIVGQERDVELMIDCHCGIPDIQNCGW